MIKSILQFGLTRSAVIVLSLAVFCAAGIAAFYKLNIEAYPNPAPVILEITAQAAGLSAEEMEKYYTIPMEVGLYSTPGVVNIRSTSFYGLSFVRVTFKYGVDYYFALSQATNNLTQNVQLPGNQIPQIQQSSLVGEIFRYQLVGPPNFGLTNLRTLQDYVVARRLMTIPGVVQINSWGGTTKQFNVDADLEKLEAYNITVPQLISALGNANINVGGREIAIGQQSVNIRGIGLINSGGEDDVTKGYRVRDIENVVLTQSNGLPIQIKDVAKVSVGYVPRLGIAGKDRDDDVAAAIVVMGRTQHTNDIVPKVEEEVTKINSDGTLPPGVKIAPYYDRTSLVSVTTHTVLHNLVFGCLLVFVIQWVFLGDLRSALIVSANIPFALFFAIIILVLQGEDANLLSLGAVDFGIIVDSAVIMMENIFRNFQSAPENRLRVLQHLAQGYWGTDPTTSPSGQPAPGWTERLRMIFVSALQVDKAVFFTAAITVTAFVPLFTMQGVEGQIFGPMARTYGYALAGALLATFTVTPVLASLLLPKHIEETETVIVRSLRQAYTPVLRWSLSHLRVAVAAGIIFLGLSGLAASRLGSEFLPALEEGNFWIRASMPPTMSLDAGTEPTRKMREILLRHPEIITVVSQHGRPDNGSDASAFSNVELFAPIKPFDQWPPGLTKEKLTEELQKEFDEELPGVTFNFSQYIQDNVEEALSGVKGANSVKIIGPNLAVLEQLAGKVAQEMAKIRGVADLGVFHLVGQPNLNIKVNREKTARYGLNTGDVTTVVQAALGGTSATTVLEGDRQFGVVVRLDPKFRQSIDEVREIKVAYQTPSGSNAYIPLSELADISLDTGASFIYRERSQRYIPIKFSVRGRDLGSTVAEAQRRVAEAVQLPAGYRMIWSGEFDNLEAAKARLLIVVPVTLLLIFVLLYSLFNSLRDSLLALAGIPFAVGGGLIALYLAGLDFSISAAIGFISLFGVAVMDGILNITYFRELRASGMSIAEAVFNGAEQRMRPMLMTALSAGVGLFPAALSHGIGSQVQRPLATVVVGGMFIGPLLLLIVAPALRKIFLSRERVASPDETAAAAPPKQRIRGAQSCTPSAQECLATQPPSPCAALAVAAGALMLASCAVGPNFAPPAAPDVERFTAEKLASPSANTAGPSVPKQHFVNGEDVSLRWWTAFRSKPLDELIKMSVEHNPSLQSAEAAIRIAQYNALAQRGLFFPQIGANYTPSQQQISGASSSGPGGQSPSVFSLHTAQLNVSFVPDIWGQNVRAVESLDAISEQQLFQLEAAYLTLTANVVTAAIQEASLRGQIGAIQRVVKIERGILEIVKNQFNAGGAAQVDVLAQEAALAQSEQLLPPLEKQLAVQRDLLTSLAGQFSADEILQKFTLDRLTLPANLPVSLPSKVIRQRPDVRAAEALLHSANAQIGVAIAARLPNITISGNAGTTAFTLAELFTPGTSFYAIAASATQPIFDGLTLYHKQKAAEAAVDQADALYRQAVITAMQNVADALRSLQADARALQAAVKAELAAKASLDIIQKQLALGQVNQVVVLNAQQVYLNAAVVRVQAQATRLSDTAALFMALGGGWPTNCASDDWRKCALEDAPTTTAQQVSENRPAAR